MEKEQAIQDALALADDATIAMLGTNGDNGYPNIKAMIKMENEGLKTVWFSTNTSSKRHGSMEGTDAGWNGRGAPGHGIEAAPLALRVRKVLPTGRRRPGLFRLAIHGAMGQLLSRSIQRVVRSLGC
jgi:hypothetical protein